LDHCVRDMQTAFFATSQFANKLRDMGRNVTLISPEQGDHYQSMLDEGIPAGIAWLRALPGE
jgi:hypothetical protein